MRRSSSIAWQLGWDANLFPQSGANSGHHHRQGIDTGEYDELVRAIGPARRTQTCTRTGGQAERSAHS
jgi:hypothetical protein